MEPHFATMMALFFSLPKHGNHVRTLPASTVLALSGPLKTLLAFLLLRAQNKASFIFFAFLEKLTLLTLLREPYH